MEKRKFDPLKTVSIVIIVVWELIIYFFSDQPMFLGLWVFFFYQHDSVTLCGKFLPNKNSPTPHAPETKIVK